MSIRDDLRLLGRAIRRELSSPWLCACGAPKNEQAKECLGCRTIAQDERERREATR